MHPGLRGHGPRRRHRGGGAGPRARRVTAAAAVRKG